METETLTYVVVIVAAVVFPSPESDFSGAFGLVTITTMNFLSSILYSDIAVSSTRILPEIVYKKYIYFGI